MDATDRSKLLDVDDGFLLGKRYLVLDRDPLYTAEFRTDGAPQPANTNGRVLRKELLGGLLNYYHR